jgi:hypothetical protein
LNNNFECRNGLGIYEGICARIDGKQECSERCNNLFLKIKKRIYKMIEYKKSYATSIFLEFG